jgi:hypothetical protein
MNKYIPVSKANKQYTEYGKQLVKEIRSNIKTLVPHTLPDITYEVIRIQKTNHQDINIRFDSLQLSSRQEAIDLRHKLESLYSKYSCFQGYRGGTVDIKVHLSLKGKFMETSDKHWNEFKNGAS